MPLKSGFSYQTIQENTAELIRDGKSPNVAVAIALCHARKDYFIKYPEGALPEGLAFPKSARLAYRYDVNGKPQSAGAMRANPTEQVAPRDRAPSPARLRKAAKLYAAFTGDAFGKVVKIPVSAMPKEGLVFGELLVIGYRSLRDGKPYAHEFQKSSRPLLVASHDGKQIVIVGGRYIFNERGIVDK